MLKALERLPILKITVIDGRGAMAKDILLEGLLVLAFITLASTRI